jgi:hypothetical protein
MKKYIKLSFSSTKFYHLNDLKDGVNELFYNVWTSKGWENRKMFIYIYKGNMIKNTFSTRFESCIIRFNEILNANGDYSKLSFSPKHELETI